MEKADTEKELSILKSTSLEKMWNNELDEFEKEYEKYKTYRVKLQTVEQEKIKSPKKITKTKKSTKIFMDIKHFKPWQFIQSLDKVKLLNFKKNWDNLLI